MKLEQVTVPAFEAFAQIASRHPGAIFEAAYPDEDCGCPVEEWVVAGVSLSIHFEPDGTMEVFADNGDWDHTFALQATTMDAARIEAFAWANSLPGESQ